MSVLHLLHGWSDRPAVISTGQRRPRTTSTAIYPSSITVIYVSTSTTSAVIYSFIIYATRFSGLLTRITHMDYLHGLHLHYGLLYGGLFSFADDEL